MPDQLLHRHDEDGVATLTLNNPASLNALSLAMLGALESAFTALAADATIRVVILAGEGRAFCAGHDLKEMQTARTAPDKGASFYAELFAQCARVMQMIPALPQPVIAQVHGLATAAGCQLAASCDLVTAADTARFAGSAQRLVIEGQRTNDIDPVSGHLVDCCAQNFLFIADLAVFAGVGIQSGHGNFSGKSGHVFQESYGF